MCLRTLFRQPQSQPQLRFINLFNKTTYVMERRFGTVTARVRVLLPFSRRFVPPGRPRGTYRRGNRTTGGLVYNDDGDPSKDDGGPFSADCDRAIRRRGSRVDQQRGPGIGRVLLLLPGRVPLHSRLLQPCTCRRGCRRACNPQDRRRVADPRGTQTLRHLDGHPQPVPRLTQSAACGRARAGRQAAGAVLPATDGFSAHCFLPRNPEALGPSRSPNVCARCLTTTDLHQQRWRE